MYKPLTKLLRSYKLVGIKITHRIVVQKLKVFFYLASKKLTHSIKRNVDKDSDINRASQEYSFSTLFDLDIVICVFNHKEIVKACVTAILNNTPSKYRIIFVDDGSDLETKNYLRDFCVKNASFTELLENEQNMGYTKSANRGLRAATAAYVCLLNSDTEVTWGWDTSMIQLLKADQKLAAVGPMSNHASSQSVSQEFNPYDLAPIASPILPIVGYLNGFCMILSHSALIKIGYLDEENFAPAYGEENDWAIRAYQAGFHIRVCDSAFVRHEGSVSHGTNIREKLTLKAQANLQSKYPPQVTAHHWQMTGFNPALQVAKLRWENELKRRNKLNQIQEFRGLRIHFILPAGTPGGGIKVILQEIKVMRACGIDAKIVNLRELKSLFHNHHPSYDVPVIWVDDFNFMPSEALNCDVIVATLYKSTAWINSSLLNSECNPRRAYYVQDYEPWFFEPSTSQFEEARESYMQNLSWLFLTKTKWMTDFLMNEHGISARNVGPSYDPIDYFPGKTLSRYSNPLAVSMMVRHESPRRNPEGTIDFANEVFKTFGNRLKVIVFGDHLKENLNHGIEHRGVLTSTKVAEVFKESDFFFDLSHFQAMGLTTLEAMASGTIPVSNAPGGINELIENCETGFLYKKDQGNGILLKLIEDFLGTPSSYDEIARNAISSVQKYSPENAVLNLLKGLTSDAHE